MLCNVHVKSIISHFQYFFKDDKNGKVVCNREDLKALQPLSVIVINRPKPLDTLFFRNVMPDLHIQYCPHCYKVYINIEQGLQYV